MIHFQNGKLISTFQAFISSLNLTPKNMWNTKFCGIKIVTFSTNLAHTILIFLTMISSRGDFSRHPVLVQSSDPSSLRVVVVDQDGFPVA